ncbi:MAG: hypothetical protein WCD38_12315 [Candidatus Tumulicola sp.]
MWSLRLTVTLAGSDGGAAAEPADVPIIARIAAVTALSDGTTLLREHAHPGSERGIYIVDRH